MPELKLFQIVAPSAGLDKHHPATMIQDDASPSAENVRVLPGVLFKRLGYTTLTSASVASSGYSGVASGVTSGPYLGQDFPRLGGSVTAMLATISSLYKWASGWSAIKSGLNGAADGYHSATVMNDTWIYTNGVDHVQVWTGTGDASDLAGGDDYQTPAYHLCRGVLSFSDRLLLLGTNEDGTWYPYRVRWSELGKTNEYDESQGGGYADLVEDPSGIRGGELLGNWAIIYCGESIWQCIYVGGTTVVNTFNRVVPNKGTHSPRTIKAVDQEHIFMGNDDVYRFNGSSLLGIGQPIRDELFRAVSPANRMRCFAEVDETKKLYHLFVPYGKSGGEITRDYIYNYEDGTWVIDTRPLLTMAAMLQLGTRLTIDDFPSDQTIDQFPHNLTIDDFGGQEDKQYLITGHEDGYIYKDDRLQLNDNGVAIDSYWCTKDLVLDPDYIHEYKRIEEILFEASGDTLKVEYSTDRGDTWTTATESQALAPQYDRYMIPIDTTGRAIRLRFTNETLSERFWIRWIGVRFMVEATR